MNLEEFASTHSYLSKSRKGLKLVIDGREIQTLATWNDEIDVIMHHDFIKILQVARTYASVKLSSDRTKAICRCKYMDMIFVNYVSADMYKLHNPHIGVYEQNGEWLFYEK